MSWTKRVGSLFDSETPKEVPDEDDPCHFTVQLAKIKKPAVPLGWRKIASDPTPVRWDGAAGLREILEDENYPHDKLIRVLPLAMALLSGSELDGLIRQLAATLEKGRR